MKASSPCYCVTVRRAAQAITQLYDAALEPTGLKITQFSLLRAIARRGPVSITELAAAVYLDRTTLGRNLRVLERDGLVSLTPGADHRERVAQLTTQGQTALAAAEPLWKATQARVRAALGEEQLKTLTGLLEQAAAIAP